MLEVPSPMMSSLFMFIRYLPITIQTLSSPTLAELRVEVGVSGPVFHLEELELLLEAACACDLAAVALEPLLLRSRTSPLPRGAGDVTLLGFAVQQPISPS